MKRIIKDYRSISDFHLGLIKGKYPKGFSDSDIVELRTSSGDYIDALELHHNDTIFLVKINEGLMDIIEDYEHADEFREEADRELGLDESYLA